VAILGLKGQETIGNGSLICVADGPSGRIEKCGLALRDFRSSLGPSIREQVARTAGFAVRVFSLAVIATVPYFIAASKLRRPFHPDPYFFIAVRPLRRRNRRLTVGFLVAFRP
jgi:hypothetical protein